MSKKNIVADKIFGKSLRKINPRSLNSKWQPPSDRPDPIELLIKSNKDRLEDLIPVRFGRMSESPFAFYRGAAAIMASDLSFTPNSGIQIQSCGDCHLMNYGFYSTPERNIVFDIIDFDESHIAPWEWDLKRLTASFVIAGQENKFSDKVCKKAAMNLVRSYHESLLNYSSMRVLDVWYNKISESLILKVFSADKEFQKKLRKSFSKAKKSFDENSYSEMLESKNHITKLKEKKDLIYHAKDIDSAKDKMNKFFSRYRDSLSGDKKYLFDKFRFSDVAYKVVGVGSVGTRCYIALFIDETEDPLILQIKEARQSVLEQFNEKSPYKNNGERIVTGQRLMQAVSDIFLGWTETEDGKHFYVRQLRDIRIEIEPEKLSTELFISYAALCGWVLAKSHSKAGEGSAISSYIGNSNKFDKAITEFAFEYAEQNKKDFKNFKKAIDDKKITAKQFK